MERERTGCMWVGAIDPIMAALSDRSSRCVHGVPDRDSIAGYRTMQIALAASSPAHCPMCCHSEPSNPLSANRPNNRLIA